MFTCNPQVSDISQGNSFAFLWGYDRPVDPGHDRTDPDPVQISATIVPIHRDEATGEIHVRTSAVEECPGAVKLAVPPQGNTLVPIEDIAIYVEDAREASILQMRLNDLHRQIKLMTEPFSSCLSLGSFDLMDAVS